jgi:ABC-type Zn uptake system ZnuABC Zn-binding protein ZnuA
MLRVGVDNLKQMLAVETDPDKKELYEAQLKVLELKLKNGNA